MSESADIEIRPNARKVELALEKECRGLTLRRMLPHIKCPVKLKVMERGDGP